MTICICKRCSRERIHKAKGLCRSCYQVTMFSKQHKIYYQLHKTESNNASKKWRKQFKAKTGKYYNELQLSKIKEKLGNKCIICEYTKILDLHHVNGRKLLKHKYDFSKINELVVLCPNCHALLHRHNLTLEELKNEYKK